METRFIFALMSAVLGGLYNFFLRIANERGYSPSYMLFYTNIVFSLLALAYFLINGYVNGFSLSSATYVLFLGFGNCIFYYLSVHSRMDSLKYIHSVIFYPIYKTIGPILITLMSLFLFKESLLAKEALGIAVGICVPLMLITKAEGKIQKNLKRGIILVIATAFLTAISTGFVKWGVDLGYGVDEMMLITALFGVLFSLVSHHSTKKVKRKAYKYKGLLKFSIFNGFLHFTSAVSFFLALEGNLAIVFTINSFSILIPIILSIIIYKEHFNFKKAIVIFLSIISLLLFI